MEALTLFAAPCEEGVGSYFLATDDGRFSVSASVHSDVDGAQYLHIRVRLQTPNAEDGFGSFHVVVDAHGALWQMAVGETDEQVASRMIERMRENDVDLQNLRFEDLVARGIDTPRASVLYADDGRVALRAKAYSEALDDESLVCLRLLFDPFGAVQIVVSDYGRLLAIATGRRDREAYQRVRHELERRGFELDAPNARSERGLV